MNLNLYHYGGNNPIKYVDADGNSIIQGMRKLFFSVRVTIGTLDYDLGRSNAQPTGSLYLQQYGTTAEHEAGLSKIISAGGLLPGVVGEVFAVASLLAVPQEEPGIVTFGDRKKFIAGAQNEIDNIDSLLNTLSTKELNETNDAGNSFGDFLKDQKDSLSKELNNNKKADEREVAGINYTMQKHGQGSYRDKRTDKAPSYAKPIDYYEAFKAEKRRQPDD